ncbi:MAG TPA: aminomethyl-transferring glycine dehydrogenase subunit GcvPA, partial [Elusimicrobiales bacterium]|nr:aminomethyl-transferring glycine dehydrogenase subunit GcvPA [Elusimicrobiales bacterium]
MYVSNTPKDREEMLSAIGVSSFGELVSQVPKQFLNPDIKLHQALNEPELMSRLEKLGSANKKLLCFAGGGAYDHFVPSAVRYIASKGEFVTAYTPYQAEASQGTLQAIYEYQSSICALFGMDVSNASHYDGATALVEAVGAAMRVTGRKSVVLPQALHPHYQATLKTYFVADPAFKIISVPCPSGVMDAPAYEAALKDAACAVLAVPNYYGYLENPHELAEKARKNGALVVALINPASLGVLPAPGEYGADFAVAEGQPLGNPINYGGPYLGVFTCKKEHIRQVPGRICGITKDADGKRAFVLTLQAREQHIRRE